MGEYDASVAATRTALKQAPETAISSATRRLRRTATTPSRGGSRSAKAGSKSCPICRDRSLSLTRTITICYASLGCAAENLALAAAARGKSGELSFDPANDGAVMFAFGSGSPAEPALFDAIPKRQSTRGDYDGKPISAADLSLALLPRLPGVDLVLITDGGRSTTCAIWSLRATVLRSCDPASCGN